MHYGTTMTGSWYRSKEVLDLLAKSPTGEIALDDAAAYLRAERDAMREQLHPLGSELGLNEVTTGQMRKAGYTTYLPNRFDGFSPTERIPMDMPPAMIEEIVESNPAMAAAMPQMMRVFSLPRIVEPLRYRGGEAAAREAQDAVRLAHEEHAMGVFVQSASPGVVTIFYPNNPKVYPDHRAYLEAMSRELRKEYQAVLAVPEVILQIDAPDLAMGKQTASWGGDFYEELPHHIDAINAAIRGLPRERIRVHYCYANSVSSHKNDADFARVLPELVRLQVGALNGEFANPQHAGDLRVLAEYAREHGWPSGLDLQAGVIDVKTPIVEHPRTVRMRLDQVAAAIGPEQTWGNTDCGFETFMGFNNVPHAVALLKLKALVDGANLPDQA
jgi:5-methyltetrahydropteroyltriglutamate--homocysteine methyltransferase